MAQFRRDNQEFLKNGNTIFEVVMVGNKNGRVVTKSNPFPVTGTPTTVSAFSENVSVELNPILQEDAIYGIESKKIETFTDLGGTATTSDKSEFVASASSTQYSYSVIRTKRDLRYRPGQGVIGRWSCRYTAGVANTSQRAGFFNQEQAYQFGYNGDEFGILHSYGGKAHIHEFTITTAPTGTQDVTITLDGDDFVFSGIVAQSAEELAAYLGNGAGSTAFTGWRVEGYDDKLVFLSEGATRPRTGSYNFSSTGNATATDSVLQNGVIATEEWTPQSQWNGEEIFDGTGPSGVTLDPTKYNVYEIKFGWLGSGSVYFLIEDPSTGDARLVHTQRWANRHTNFHVDNPNFHIGYVAYNLGGGAVTVYGGSLLGANEGKTAVTHYTSGAWHSITTISSKDVVHHLGSLYNPLVVSNKVNTRDIQLETLNVAFEGNDPINIVVYIDTPLLTGRHQFNSYPDISTKSSLVTGTFDQTAHTPIAVYTTDINGRISINLHELRTVIPPFTILSVGYISTQSITSISASIVWYID